MSKEASGAPLGRITSGAMMRAALALASGLMVTGCHIYTPQLDQTAPDEFRTTVITDESSPADDPESERDWLQYITEQMREHKLCPAGYDIVSRHVTASEAPLALWRNEFIEYRLKCRTD